MPRKSVAVFSPHAQVLFQVGRNPDIRMREIAQALEMTERNVQNLMRDLQDAGLVKVDRRGRRNRYRVQTRRRVGQELGISMVLGKFLKMTSGRARGEETAAATAPEDAEGAEFGGLSEKPSAQPSADSAPTTRESEKSRRAGLEPESESRRQIDWLSDL